MKPWLTVVACVSLAACANKTELSECTAFPPATYSKADCDAHAAGANCTLTELRTTTLTDGGISTTCHHENCAGDPTCPSAP